MKVQGALLWKPGTKSGWSVEEIELDPPRAGEVLVKLAASGICHTDEHFDVGDMPVPWAPVLGGHEGAGTVVEVGAGVTEFAVGDHVVLAMMPSCGMCAMCTSGRPVLCSLGAGLLSGRALDGTHRVHARGEGVGALCFLGTFASHAVVPAASVIKVNDEIPLDVAALLGCGVPTGWGSAAIAAQTQIGDTVVVVGVGGVGTNAVQGAVLSGARNIVAVDPVAFKRESALAFGATHAAADAAEAALIVERLTNGQGAERVVVTVGVATPEVVQPAAAMTQRGGVLVVTSASSPFQQQIDFDLCTFVMSGKRLQGTVYGGARPRTDIPMLADMYVSGRYKLDELITRRYPLEKINDAFADLRDGKNIRGLIEFE